MEVTQIGIPDVLIIKSEPYVVGRVSVCLRDIKNPFKYEG